jgi:hypothetical protein
MKNLLVNMGLAAICAGAGALLAMPLSAQPDGRYDGRYERGDGWGDRYGDGFTRGSNFPGGSWRESCRFPSWQGARLTAECRTSNDRWVRARINPDRCPDGRLLNADGRLVCEGSGGSWGQGGGWALPGGSWRQTCRYPLMRGNFLSAQCESGGNRWFNSSIDPRQCRSGRIENRDGRLSCEDGGSGWGGSGWGGGGYPGGTWQRSCRDASVRGSVLYALCDSNAGYPRESSIDYRQCRSVGNDNGRLVCE